MLLQHACPLPNCQPDPWPVLNDPLEDAPSLIKATAGEDQIKHTRPVFAPLLDLVEVPAVGVGWIFLRRTSCSLRGARDDKRLRRER